MKASFRLVVGNPEGKTGVNIQDQQQSHRYKKKKTGRVYSFQYT
jgi:hypothetical protein